MVFFAPATGAVGEARTDAPLEPFTAAAAAAGAAAAAVSAVPAAAAARFDGPVVPNNKSNQKMNLSYSQLAVRWRAAMWVSQI